MNWNSEKSGVQQAQLEDIFREIGNIGTGACAASLSHMIGAQVEHSSPDVMAAEYEVLSDWFGYAGENAVGVLIPFGGEIRGMVLQIYKRGMVKAILEGVLERSLENGELDGRLLDILREIANIAASSYLTSLSACTGCKIDVSGAAVSMDMVGAIITELLGTAGAFDETLCIGNKFRVNGEGDSHILVMLQMKSVQRLMEVLGVEF